MAEFPELSTHCHLQSCKCVDFLPFQCAGCGHSFCLDHRTYESHGCSNPQEDFKAVFCPICDRSITIHQGEDPDHTLSKHIDDGCPPTEAEKMLKEAKRRNRCSLRTCRKYELTPVVCKACKQKFCMAHRLEMDHECPGKPPAPKTKSGRSASAGRGSNPKGRTQQQAEECRRLRAERYAQQPRANRRQEPEDDPQAGCQDQMRSNCALM